MHHESGQTTYHRMDGILCELLSYPQCKFFWLATDKKGLDLAFGKMILPLFLSGHSTKENLFLLSMAEFHCSWSGHKRVWFNGTIWLHVLIMNQPTLDVGIKYKQKGLRPHRREEVSPNGDHEGINTPFRLFISLYYSFWNQNSEAFVLCMHTTTLR